MKKADLLSTLFVGIDISSRENVVALLDFESSKPILSFAVANNQPGAVALAQKLADFLNSHRDLSRLMIALESTSFYGIHIANYLSSCQLLMPFHTAVYCVNPKMIANYKKSFIDLGKMITLMLLSLPTLLVLVGLLLTLGVAANFLLYSV